MWKDLFNTYDRETLYQSLYSCGNLFNKIITLVILLSSHRTIYTCWMRGRFKLAKQSPGIYIPIILHFLCMSPPKKLLYVTACSTLDLQSISPNLTSMITDLILHQAEDQHQQKSVSCKPTPSTDLHSLPTKDKDKTQEDERRLSSWITDQFPSDTNEKILTSSLTVFEELQKVFKKHEIYWRRDEEKNKVVTLLINLFI